MTHKLLLADDSVTIQRVIELTFADEDINVTTVGDGQQAIERLDSDPPDIVLADVDMPKRDGYEVAAYVKSRPKLAHIPVVLLTGAFEPIDQARAKASGSSDVLAKPFEPQMVINRVKELLGRKRPDEDATMGSPEPGPSQPQMSSPQQDMRQQGAEGNEPVSLDDYFDQLDAAFSNLQPGVQPTDGSHEIDWPPLETVPAPAAEQPVIADTPVEKPVASKPAASVFPPKASEPPDFLGLDAPVRHAETSASPSAHVIHRHRRTCRPHRICFTRRTCRDCRTHRTCCTHCTCSTCIRRTCCAGTEDNDQSVREPVGRKGRGCRPFGGACYHGRRHRRDRVACASAHERPHRSRDGDRYRLANRRAAGPGRDRADTDGVVGRVGTWVAWVA